MGRFSMLAVALLTLAGASSASGQDTDEVKRLKKEVELLQAKLEAANLKIERLQMENDQLKASLAKGSEKKLAADPFAKGAVWAGARKIDGVDGLQDWDLTITERGRDGSFKGEMRLFRAKDNTFDSFPAAGNATTASEGAVGFTAEKGKFKQVFKGKLKNGQVGMEFSGPNPFGMPSKGTATLDPK